MARVFEFPDTTTKWVPRPSRILRRAGTGLPAAWDFVSEAHATRVRKRISPHPTFTCTRGWPTHALSARVGTSDLCALGILV